LPAIGRDYRQNKIKSGHIWALCEWSIYGTPQLRTVSCFYDLGILWGAMKKFGSFLSEKRKAAGLPQKAIADYLGWETPQYISNIERGISLPPIKNLKAMAFLLKINAEDLYKEYEAAILRRTTEDLKRKFRQSSK